MYRPVRPHHTEFCVQIAALLDSLTHEFLHALPIIRVDCAQPLRVSEMTTVGGKAMKSGILRGNHGRVGLKVLVPYSQSSRALGECKMRLAVAKCIFQLVHSVLKVIYEILVFKP